MIQTPFIKLVVVYLPPILKKGMQFIPDLLPRVLISSTPNLVATYNTLSLSLD